MPTAYIGPGWENPERKKIFGGSVADVYIRDGFTVACLVEVSFIDKQARRDEGDLLIFSPLDPYMTPVKTAVDFDQAEQNIKDLRARHPEWPTEPVPPKISIPEFTTVEEAAPAVIQLSRQLEGLDLRGYPPIEIAKFMFLYGGRVFRNWYVSQDAVDHGIRMAKAAAALGELTVSDEEDDK